MTGEKEPEIIARFQEFLFEPDAQEAPQSSAARRRAHRLAKIGLDRRRILGKDIYFVETGFFIEEITQRFGVALSVLQGLQIVIAVDADTNCPILAHFDQPGPVSATAPVPIAPIAV